MVKRALLIGINYFNTNTRLYGCINDVMAMNNLLIDAYGYNKTNICVLRDDNMSGYDMPTKENILKELNKLVSLSNQDDEIWIHYSGHGSYIRDTNGDEYDGRDEIIIPCDYSAQNIIVDDELKQIFNNSKGLIYITLDCCFSGTGWDLPFLFRSYNNRLYRWNISRTMNNTNIYMLSGSRDYQTAADYYNREYTDAMGAFTNALIECLRFNNHNVSLFKLNYDINLYLKTNNFTQISELTSSNSYPLRVKITRSGILNVQTKTLNHNIIKNNMRLILN